MRFIKMNRKKWICAAAAITGLLLAVIAGLSIIHMKNSSYVSASELAGQKKGEEVKAAEDNENAGMSESNGNGEDRENNQDVDRSIAETKNSMDHSEADSLKSENEVEAADQPVNLVFSGDILLSDHVMNAYKNGGIRSVPDSQFQSVIDEADIFMANEEFPFSTRGTPAEDKQLPSGQILLLYQFLKNWELTL